MREQLHGIARVYHENRRGVLVASAFAVMAAVVEVVSIAMYYPVLAILTGTSIGGGVSSWLLTPLSRLLGAQPGLLALLTLLVALVATRAVCLYLARIVSNHYELLLNLRLKRTFLRRLAGSSWEFMLRAEPGSLLNVFSQYTTSTSRALFCLVESIIDAVSCLAYLAFAIYVSPFFAVFVILAGFVAGPVLRRIYWQIKALVERNIRLRNDLANKFLDYFQGLKTFKSMSLEESYLREIDRDVQCFTSNEQRSYRFQAGLNVLGEPLFAAISASFLLVAYYGFDVAIETVVIFFALLSKSYSRLNGLQMNVGKLVISSAAVRFVEDFERRAAAASEAVAGRPLAGPITTVELEDVRFAYPDGNEVFKGISVRLDVQRGLIAVAGSSGAGKSTLLDLLLGLLRPSAGTVRINGIDLQEIDLPALRARVGFVPQRPVLFSRSIWENISLREEAETDLARVEEAAMLADAHAFISRLSSGYASVMGEDGASLSLGQIQRISIARALYQRPEVLFVDEPTSALDPRAAAEVMCAIERVADSYPVFLVSHSAEARRNARVALVVEDGTVRVTTPVGAGDAQ
ncbi:MAG: ATP-binding cassette domain-containing protein [Gammaproteobacteria bacterium]